MATTLVEQIEEMRIRMHEQALSEQDLINALGQALKRADETLLEAIRNVAFEHELRREGILRELQAMAARLGVLPASRVPLETPREVPLNLPNYDTQRRRPLSAPVFGA
jgi:hypothetical protein